MEEAALDPDSTALAFPAAARAVGTIPWNPGLGALGIDFRRQRPGRGWPRCSLSMSCARLGLTPPRQPLPVLCTPRTPESLPAPLRRVCVEARGSAVRGCPGPEGPWCPDPGVSSRRLVRILSHDHHLHVTCDLHSLDWARDPPVPWFGVDPAHRRWETGMSHIRRAATSLGAPSQSPPGHSRRSLSPASSPLPCGPRAVAEGVDVELSCNPDSPDPTLGLVPRPQFVTHIPEESLGNK